MSALSRRACRLAVACCCALSAACGEPERPATDARAARTPAAVPKVVLSAADRRVWAPRGPAGSMVPVLLYSGVGRKAFARHMVLLSHAGYETITLDELVRYVSGKPVRLPPRPLLLTFDGGRLDSWTQSDAILRELGFNAVVFIDAGRVDVGDREYLSWNELNTLQRSGRWDVQLQSGTGNRRIRYGTDPDDVGPFYAYRGSDEVLGGWRERVFSDITWAEKQVAFRVRGYRPLAFAPPYGNYGQAGTNDRRIPRELLARLLDSFAIVFTRDPEDFAVRAAPRSDPVGRIEITRAITDRELQALLASAARSR